MKNNNNDWTGVDPMQIAWLLRADLRRGAPANAPISTWFKVWWIINGPFEYPEWTDHNTLLEAKLFTPLPHWPVRNGFGMTPALEFLLEVRPDLAGKFDISTEEGLWDAIAWLFVHGVRDHQLAPALDQKTLAALDATPQFLALTDVASSEVPQLSWLMYFAWRNNNDLKAQFNLNCITDRHNYVEWFLLYGVNQLKLTQLVMPRWKDWLREPISEDKIGSGIPRAAYLLWQRHQQLQVAFDLTTRRGNEGLKMWAREVWNTQTELSWIDQQITPLNEKKRDQRQRPFGLNLIGFAFGELGIGEDVRMAVAACESAGIPFAVVNIHAGDSLRQNDNALSTYVDETNRQENWAPFAINLFCLTAFDTARVFLEKGPSLFDSRYNIGWWPWELPVWPKDWLIAFSIVDEVWSATSFTHDMYTRAATLASPTPPPITLMPMAVSVDRVSIATRLELELPQERFLFLYIFDFNSYLKRKNPFAAVEAFRKAFPLHDKSVGLVLKTMNSNPNNSVWTEFLNECSKDDRIKIIDYTMERGKVLGLLQACDAYLSLHRAEGFGRTMAEAMLFGKPVIATDFSGNVDFLNDSTGFRVLYYPSFLSENDYPFVTLQDKAWWVDPDVDHASIQMRKAKSEWNNNRQKSLQIKSRNIFSPQRAGRRIRARINSIRCLPSRPHT